MKFIDPKTIDGAATLTEWVEAMEQAIVFSLSQDYIMPQRMHLDSGDDTFLIMPCLTKEYWVTKLVSFCPGNMSMDLPSIYGTVVLSRTGSGEPLAILEGNKITSLRTAAISALGIKYLAPEGAESLGIVGTGVQGIQQARFACSVRNIKQINIYDKSEKSISAFMKEFKSEFPNINTSVSSDTEDLCSASEIIITATNSRYPVFPDKKGLFEGKTFIGVGSYKKESREYPDSFFNLPDQVFVDTVHAKKESGDLIFPVTEKLIPDECIYSLGSLIKGDISLTARPTKFFKTVGSAIFDLYAAKLAYEKTS